MSNPTFGLSGRFRRRPLDVPRSGERSWHQPIKLSSSASLNRVLSKQTLTSHSTDSLGSFCPINTTDDTNSTVCRLLFAHLICLRVCKHCPQAEIRVYMHLRHMGTLAYSCLYLWVFSRAELRWATACCSAVTTPALVCIIYPPADWSREKGITIATGAVHARVCVHGLRKEKHWLHWWLLLLLLLTPSQHSHVSVNRPCILGS